MLKWFITKQYKEQKKKIFQSDINMKISGSESFTRWLAPGSELGASWSEGSKPNVILGFRVPTTIGLRKSPAGSPCSQLAPLASRASLGP